MRLTIFYFAAAREKAGVASESLDLTDSATAADLRAEVARLHPPLASFLNHMRIAVNHEFADDKRALFAGDEIAIIPPVSGGSGPGEMFNVQDAPLDPSAAIARVSSPDRGGLCTFVGSVRGTAKDGRRVLRLEYEAYPAMVLALFAAIARECVESWGATVAIDHRVGVVEPGGVSVVVAAAAPHRAQSFDACRHAIERLKHDAPIWKREVYEDGSVWVGMGP